MADRSDDLRLLLDVIPYLQRHGGVTLDELARMLDCTPEEAQQVLDRILMCGVPPYSPRDYVSVFHDADGRIYAEFADHFRRPVRFSAAEITCLKMILRDPLLSGGTAASSGDDADTDPMAPVRESLLARLDAISPAADESDDAGAGDPGARVHVAGPGSLARRHAETLQQAIRDGHRVRMRHFSWSRAAIVEREVSPAVLQRQGDLLYLIGFDHTYREQWVHFRIDRIESITVQPDAPADRAPARELDDLVETGPRPRDARRTGTGLLHARIEPRVVPWLREAFGERAIRRGDDGTVQLHVALASENWLVRFLLAWGEEIEVLEPASARDRMRQLLDELIAQHED